MPPRVAAALQSALADLNAGHFAAARAILATLARDCPDIADIRFLLGATLRHLGQADAAEHELVAARALDPARQDIVVELARLLMASGRAREARDSLRATVACQPGEAALRELARAHALLGERREHVSTLERLADAYPNRPTHHHNLAAALGDAGDAERSEAAARAALIRRDDLPETWLVLARALQAQSRLDEAEAGFRRAIRLRPDYVDARRDLSQLLWMRDGDLDAARRIVGIESPEPGTSRQLRIIEARLLEIAGHGEEALALLTSRLADDPGLLRMASHLAIAIDPVLALDHARRAHALAPQSEDEERQLFTALIAVGDHAEALRRIEALQTRLPLDQGLIGMQWAVLKQTGDPRADALYDYDSMVLSQSIETPRGWSSLDQFLADLADHVAALHTLRRHPFDQSLRNGSQTSANLLASHDPVITAFREAITEPIRQYLRRLGPGKDRLRARNLGDHGFAGMWSVRFSAGGFHLNHTHSQGWISSAFHLQIPSVADNAGREGWLTFGEPGIRTTTPMSPGHLERPRAGRLVLFPSYMWHGTVPFQGQGTRLSIAFDVIPAHSDA